MIFSIGRVIQNPRDGAHRGLQRCFRDARVVQAFEAVLAVPRHGPLVRAQDPYSLAGPGQGSSGLAVAWTTCLRPYLTG